MNRRRFLALVAAGLAVPAARALAADVGERIEWRDLTLLDGATLLASELRGRVVVVEFWASWCPFCARQNPLIEALHREHGGRGLTVLTFSIDKNPSTARAYLREHRYTFPAAMADGATLRRFDLRHGLPVLFVVDGDGKVIRRESGEMFEEDVRELGRYARRGQA